MEQHHQQTNVESKTVVSSVIVGHAVGHNNDWATVTMGPDAHNGYHWRCSLRCFSACIHIRRVIHLFAVYQLPQNDVFFSHDKNPESAAVTRMCLAAIKPFDNDKVYKLWRSVISHLEAS